MPLDYWFEASSHWLCDIMHKKDVVTALEKLPPNEWTIDKLNRLKKELISTLKEKSHFSEKILEITIEERIREWVQEQKLAHLLKLFDETERDCPLQQLHEKFPEYTEEELEFFTRHHDRIKRILEKSPYFTKKDEKPCPNKILKQYWSQIKRVIDSDHRQRLYEHFRQLKEQGLDEKLIIGELKGTFPEIATIPTQFVLNHELHLQQRNEKDFFFKFLKEEDLTNEELFETLKKRFPDIEKDEIGLLHKVYAIDTKNLLLSIIEELKAQSLSDRDILSALYFEFPFLTHSELQEMLTEAKFNSNT